MPGQTQQEELRAKIELLNGSEAHACYCPRSLDGGCKCALKDEYVNELMGSLKVKIVQIAYMGDEGRTEYLDSAGRVWYDAGGAEKYSEDGKLKYKWVSKWVQIEMPEEPTL